MKNSGQSRIKSIGWGFGLCDMNCPKCYSHAGSGRRAPCYAIEELQAVADKICDAGVTDINYGTGEFIMNPNVVDLLRYIHDRYPAVKQAVTTNGATLKLIDKALLRHFHDVDISVDFADPETHNRSRGHPLAWKWIIEGLKILEDLGMEKSIVTCVTGTHTDKDLLELLEFCELHDATGRYNFFRETGAQKDLPGLVVSAKRHWEIIRLLVKEGVVFESLSDPLLAAIFGKANEYGLKGCPCGQVSCRIQKDMEVTPCVYLGGPLWSAGNIQKVSLASVYETDPFRRIRERYPKECRECKYGDVCRGGCASRAYLSGGDLNLRDVYCPFLAGPEVMEIVEEIRELGIKTGTGTEKVHDGYLCTIMHRRNS